MQIVSKPALLVSQPVNLTLQCRNNGAVGTLAMPIITGFCSCNMHLVPVVLKPFQTMHHPCDILQSDYTIFSAFWFITLATQSIPIIYQISCTVLHPYVLKVSAGAGSWMLRQALRFGT